MTKAVKDKKKDRSIFNFDVYKTNSNYFIEKIKSLVDDQIKFILELENQAQGAFQDEKSCILSETPSQQRRRMFNITDMVSSSPLRETDQRRLNFESVIRNANQSRLAHFDNDSVKQKLFFGGDGSDEPEAEKPRDVTQTKKRKLDASSRNTPTKKAKIEGLKNGKSHFTNVGKKNTTTLDKNNTVEISASKIEIDDKKEKVRLRAVAVEIRRKAAETERLRKIEIKAQENEKKEEERKKRLMAKIDKSNITASPFGASTSKNTNTQSQKIITPIKLTKLTSSTPLIKPFLSSKPTDTKNNLPQPSFNFKQTDLPTIPEIPNLKENEAPRRETFVVPEITPIKANQKVATVTSYKITPESTAQPKPVAPPLDDDDYNCYDILDLKSGDSTDDERAPQKPIPKWAQDKFLWRAIVSQHKDIPINGEEVFGPIPLIETASLFSNPSHRYTRRTSSSHWDPSFLDISLSKL